MSAFGTQGLRLAAVAAVLLFSAQAQAQSRLQQIADDAALAAVQVLGAGGGAADAAAVAEQTVAANPGAAAKVSASTADRSVSVVVSAADAKAANISSTAHYLPPDQPATWAWASRQRFTVKPSSVVVGSYCLRDCGPSPLR